MVNLTRRIAVLLVMALSVGMGLMFAQTDRGTITGTVTDSSGARVAGASINLTATTGVTSNAKSNTDGVYNFLFLPIGHYAITVEHPGFKKYDQQGITLSVGQTLGIDIVLQVGNLQQKPSTYRREHRVQSETTNVATTATSTSCKTCLSLETAKSRNPGFFMVHRIPRLQSRRGGPGGGGGDLMTARSQRRLRAAPRPPLNSKLTVPS